MSTRKTIGGALGAIIVLIVAQILAQLVASLFVLVKIPEGICNIIAGKSENKAEIETHLNKGT